MRLGFLGGLTTKTYHESQEVVREGVGAPKVSLGYEEREPNAQIQLRV